MSGQHGTSHEVGGGTDSAISSSPSLAAPPRAPQLYVRDPPKRPVVLFGREGVVKELPQLAAVLLSVTWGARCRRRKPDTWMRKGDREEASHCHLAWPTQEGDGRSRPALSSWHPRALI